MTFCIKKHYCNCSKPSTKAAYNSNSETTSLNLGDDYGWPRTQKIKGKYLALKEPGLQCVELTEHTHVQRSNRS